jgi:phage-related minor tail protein
VWPASSDETRKVPFGLEADTPFFQGINGARRVANGRITQPATLSSPEDFIHNAFTRSEGSSVVVGEAFQEFLRFCQMGNLTRVEFTEFKRVA